MASSKPGPSMTRFFTRVAPPLPFRPPTRSVSSGSPACGTNFISIPRCVPTSTTSLSVPRDIHSLAIAIAGNTWPPVPPPAMSSFIARFQKLRVISSRRRLLRNIQQHSCRQKHHKQTGSSVADERKRDALGRNHAEHYGKIDQGLENDH